MTINEVYKFCKDNNIGKYSGIQIEEELIKKNEDGSFDFDSNVVFYKYQLENIPFKINKVKGKLAIKDSKLNTCENFPKEIGGKLIIINTPIKDIEENWGVKSIGRELYINTKDCYFNSWDFLYDTKFQKILIKAIGSSFFEDENLSIKEEYKKYISEGEYFEDFFECFYDKFEEMKRDKIIIDATKEFGKYVMEI